MKKETEGRVGDRDKNAGDSAVGKTEQQTPSQTLLTTLTSMVDLGESIKTSILKSTLESPKAMESAIDKWHLDMEAMPYIQRIRRWSLRQRFLYNITFIVASIGFWESWVSLYAYDYYRNTTEDEIDKNVKAIKDQIDDNAKAIKDHFDDKVSNMVVLKKQIVEKKVTVTPSDLYPFSFSSSFPKVSPADRQPQ
ncbi:ATP-dependent metalloprotease FtsH [Corchorus capsularis]|uniref:ATP-dependent metalloprotease FtsH n=1 Tax=Corchorus capsularis TaxID=210143 RepID=A0A1R3ILU5_COCAP|nr:ATP-dependent metalloprotease FtsH [Corchorus capsularis]